MTPGEALLTEGPEGRRTEARKARNYLIQYFNPTTKRFRNVTASQFADIWNHFDEDGNGFIDGEELQTFLSKLAECIIQPQQAPELSEKDMKELLAEVMSVIDTNKDNRIDLRELSQLLPTDEEFILLFQRETRLHSSVDFMRIWKEFDKDHSGYIEADELKDFLALLVQQSTLADENSEEKLLEYTDSILKLFDHNGDGKLQLSEMSRLLPVKENFLCRPIFKRAGRITVADVDRVFELYDTDKNGMIEDDELSGFLKDLLELVYDDYDETDLEYTKATILRNWDVNQDGKINMEEMRMLLLAYSTREMEQVRETCKTEITDVTTPLSNPHQSGQTSKVI
ncbi:unnamed protein product [Calicophoron daubneyi]|uniref:EF-hand domain-containing protein n=1 Tax=Calicophoron daubneyi TaxID=300641 RepID=A0AAV2T138_CALDB